MDVDVCECGYIYVCVCVCVGICMWVVDRRMCVRVYDARAATTR